MADLGAGPIAKTVWLPAGICVRPASHTMYVGMPSDEALAARSSCAVKGDGTHVKFDLFGHVTYNI